MLFVVFVMISKVAAFFRWLYATLMNWWHRWTGPVITLEQGLSVRVGQKLAEGGFSYVYQAEIVQETKNNKNCQKYALKRIFVAGDEEIKKSCLKEADVHHAAHHPNLMPLRGFLRTNEYCYMLFPLCSHSLREEVNRRTSVLEHLAPSRRDAPWSELQVLQLFVRLCSAVEALHEAHYTHRDIKLENILLRKDSLEMEPILMDFGSAGPLTVSLTSRNEIIAAIELAAQQTTLPYRPPELLDTTGLLHAGDTLDYRAVDVWSLGCTLFGILYGASPMECEFRRGEGNCGARIVECTTLRILNAKLPEPPPNSRTAGWYSKELTQDLIPCMLQQDRHQRPSLPKILSRLQTMIEARGSRVPPHLLSATLTVAPLEQSALNGDDDDDGFSNFYSSAV